MENTIQDLFAIQDELKQEIKETEKAKNNVSDYTKLCLTKKQDKVKLKLKEIQVLLMEEVENYEGTLYEALKSGLVRLNFCAPPGLYKLFKNNTR